MFIFIISASMNRKSADKKMERIRREIIVRMIGREKHISRVSFASQLYRSFLPFKNRTMKVSRNYILFPGAVVIDVGANIGRFTGLASELVKRSGQVHSFEPVHISFRLLKASMR